MGRFRPTAILLSACRPRRWLKNALVAVAPWTAGPLTSPGLLVDVSGAFAAFCLLPSATYLVNDVRDREQDRRHPVKRHRPVAAGELRPRRALRLATLMAVAGLGLAFAVRPALALVGAGYLALTTSYSIVWRRVVFADIVAVAAGFVLRAVGGGAAAGVGPSRSFLIVISGSALFVIDGKRHAELGARRPSRATLQRYSWRGLRFVLTAAGAFACAGYAWWALERGPRTLSLVPFVLWLARYRSLLQAGAGEAPEELVLHDPVLVGLALSWVAFFAAGVYG